MQRPKVRIDILNKNYESIVNTINIGNVFVAQNEDGYCILLNNKGNEGYKMITFSPNTDMVGRGIIPENKLQEICDNTILNPKFSFDFYEIEDREEYDIIEYYELIADALIAVKNNGHSKYYKVRKL